MKILARPGGIAAAVMILMSVFAGNALAHCDTMDGPVVTLAKKALEKGDVNLVLPWVAKEKELSDRYFFETLVRVHREGEGAPFTGLKPAGLDLGPAIPAADKALETGQPGPLLKLIDEKVHAGIHKYYTEAREKKAHAGHNVEAGRAYVQAYVPYLHFVERLYNDAATPIAHGAGEGGHEGHAAPHPEPASGEPHGH